MSPPAEYVLAAFGLAGIPGERLGGPAGRAWRHGDTVVAPAADPVEAAWAAGLFDTLRVPGVRVARPVRSSDGRWVVGGWSAQRFVAGRPAGRHRETVDVAFALQGVLAPAPRPRFLDERSTVDSVADRLAWDERTTSLPEGSAAIRAGFETLARGRREIAQPSQLVHGSLFGTVLFAGSAPPAVTGIEPLWRPAAYAAALVVVDAVAWGGAPHELAVSGGHVPQWGELLRRALLARLALSAVHPRATEQSRNRILAAAQVLTPLMG